MYYTPNNYLHNSNGKKEIVVIGKSVKDLTEQEAGQIMQTYFMVQEKMNARN